MDETPSREKLIRRTYNGVPIANEHRIGLAAAAGLAHLHNSPDAIQTARHRRATVAAAAKGRRRHSRAGGGRASPNIAHFVF